jgi:geranylgeranyl diphosphate synthase, type II
MMASSKDELIALLSENKAELDQIALNFLPANHSNPSIDSLYRMMRDYPKRGGKGLRGLLCILWCQLFGGTRDNALITSAALELFQNWILIHDDIEDESDLRRGSPALHKKYGIPLSINAGDALHGKMWELLLHNRDKLGDAVTVSILSEFCNMLNETTEGQQMELDWTVTNNWKIREEDYFLMVTKKAAWYTCITPSRLGLLISGNRKKAEIFDQLNGMGTNLGIAFQIVDDILNLTASQDKYGKEILGDIYEGKRTLMMIDLLRKVSLSEKDEIISILSKPRSQKSESEVSRIFTMMKAKGSIEYARSVALRFYQKSNESFENMIKGESLNENDTSHTMKLLFEYLAKRDY